MVTEKCGHQHDGGHRCICQHHARSSEPPSIRVCLYFYGFSGVNTGVRIYHKFYGISSVILGKFMACFFIIPMEKQTIIPKIVHNAQSRCQVWIESWTLMEWWYKIRKNDSIILLFVLKLVSLAWRLWKLPLPSCSPYRVAVHIVTYFCVWLWVRWCLISGLDYWTGLLDWTTGLTILPQKSIFR